MPETQPAAAAQSTSNNDGTPAAKQADTNASSENTTPPDKKSALLNKGWFKKLIPLVVLAMAAIILFGISGGWTRRAGSGSPKTDDAFLRADITPLSTRVSGTVVQVAVADYQRVKAGDLLVQLKDDDFKAQVAKAEAGVSASESALENNAKQKELQASRITQAQAGIQAASAGIAQAVAAIEAAKADVANSKAAVDVAEAKISDAQAGVPAAQADAERTLLERKRQEELVGLRPPTKKKLEQVTADQERFAAILDSLKAELTQTRAVVESRRAEF